MAAGLGEDPIGALFLAWELEAKPWWVAPAMNARMWLHPATQAALDRLRAWKVHVVEPGAGPHACGEEGPGRLAEPEAIAVAVLAELDRLGAGRR